MGLVLFSFGFTAQLCDSKIPYKLDHCKGKSSTFCFSVLNKVKITGIGTRINELNY